ncbi:MAG: hypothetical protein HC904_00070 [Blastochloris sp.]|nr:hypothetical protein [Blastochloris sp.]
MPAENYSFDVWAEKKWNPSGLLIEQGGIYEFRTEVLEDLSDASIPCTPDGFDSVNILMTLTEWLRRAPSDKWFCLMGTQNFKMTTAFTIGSARRDYKANHSGELMCFVNDVSGFYFNNKGRISVTVIRIE